MGMRKLKTIRAGRQVRQIVYPVPNGRDKPATRAAKQRASTEAQRLLNRKYSFEQAQDLIAENFDIGDLVLTLTYDDQHYPASRKAAEAKLKRWRAQVSTLWAAQHWPKPVIFWVTEDKHGDGRLHHHVIIKKPPGKCYALLRSCWSSGSVMDVKPLRVDAERNYETLARYLTKEAPELGRHQWHITRNASRPDVDVRWVDGSFSLQPPRGSLLFDSRGSRQPLTGAGYQYAYYILPLQKRPRRRK